MHRLLCTLLLCLIAARSVEAAPPEPLRVMSFNIRYGTAKDGPNHWDLRKDFLVETIKAFKPDPRAYELVLSELGLPREACVFVDDQKKNIEGAEAVNLPYVHFDVTRPAESYARALAMLGL